MTLTTAAAWAKKLAKSLQFMYCQHWAGAYCDICAEKMISGALAAYAHQRVEAFRERAEKRLAQLASSKASHLMVMGQHKTVACARCSYDEFPAAIRALAP